MPRKNTIRKSVNILLTNDDGIHSKGLVSLARALSRKGTLTVVAPDRERSAAGHSLTLHRPFRADLVSPGWYAVDGTPTDCVNLGIYGLMKKRPDIILSGINRGGNLGDDITYSGTVSAALEGCLLGIPSIAVSLVIDDNSYFDTAADIVCGIMKKVLHHGLPRFTFLNINVPDIRMDHIKGIKVTCQGRKRYGDTIITKKDPRNRPYYWIGSGEARYERVVGSDIEAVMNDFVSVTPLHTDMTNHSAIHIVRKWGF